MLRTIMTTPRCMLQREGMPTLFHYYSNMTQMSIVGMWTTRLPCIGLPSMEHFLLGNVFLIMVQIPMLEKSMVLLHFFTRHAKDTSSLLKCYLNAGRRLMPGISMAELRCTRQSKGVRSRSC